MRVLVLGCGPAGLMAVHAAALQNHSVTIMSDRVEPSTQYGCQYLHDPIPEATDPSNVRWVEYKLQGPASGYKRKVYGKAWDVEVSPESLSGYHPAWDIRQTYERLWGWYGHWVQKQEVTAANVENMMEWVHADVVVSSIPKPDLCPYYMGDAFGKYHYFRSQAVFAAGEAHGLGIRFNEQIPEGMVICNGWERPAWYRASNVFGHKTIEWPVETPSTLLPDSVAKVNKPIGNTCDCHPEIIHVGRYGEWRKGVLSSDAFSVAYTGIKRAAARVEA